MTVSRSAPAGTSAAGLRGVAAATSSISDVNGEKGELIYQGYNIHDLVEHSTFEEVVFLLWNKRLPTASELSELEQSIRAAYEDTWNAWNVTRTVASLAALACLIRALILHGRQTTT